MEQEYRACIDKAQFDPAFPERVLRELSLAQSGKENAMKRPKNMWKSALIAAARLCESSRAREKNALLAAAREARTAARAPMTGTRETRVEGDASRNDAPFGVAAAANRATESREEEPRNPATPARAPMKGARETRAKAVARAALLVAAAALIALGVRNGGLRDVLIKAINICTECIGLG